MFMLYLVYMCIPQRGKKHNTGLFEMSHMLHDSVLTQCLTVAFTNTSCSDWVYHTNTSHAAQTWRHEAVSIPNANSVYAEWYTIIGKKKKRKEAGSVLRQSSCVFLQARLKNPPNAGPCWVPLAHDPQRAPFFGVGGGAGGLHPYWPDSFAPVKRQQCHTSGKAVKLPSAKANQWKYFDSVHKTFSQSDWRTQARLDETAARVYVKDVWTHWCWTRSEEKSWMSDVMVMLASYSGSSVCTSVLCWAAYHNQTPESSASHATHWLLPQRGQPQTGLKTLDQRTNVGTAMHLYCNSQRSLWCSAVLLVVHFDGKQKSAE